MDAKAKLGLVRAIIVAGFGALVFDRQVNIFRQVHAEETEACSAQAAEVGVFVSDGQGKLSGSDTISDGNRGPSPSPARWPWHFDRGSVSPQ